jgi:hypothetical protein
MSAHRVSIEGDIWDPRRAWTDALKHLASRFERSTPLDVTAFPELDEQATQLADHVDRLDEWAPDGVDWRREVGRFLDERLPKYARPDRRANQRLRDLATQDGMVFVTALPDAIAESVLRHLGLLRIASSVEHPTRAH